MFMSLIAASSSSAALPSGLFTGTISNNPLNELCQLNQASIEFIETGNRGVTVNWIEQGLDRNTSYCENRFDLTLTPSSTANSWDANFLWNYNLYFGKATLANHVLTITANYSASTTHLNFETKLTINQNTTSLDYERRIERWNGPTLIATGALYQH